jgi:hypothetical protein
MTKHTFNSDLVSIVEDLYVYCHLSWEKSETNYYITATFIVMIFVFICLIMTTLKMILIFIYFFFIHICCTLSRYIYKIITKKCKINFKQDLISISGYITRILKKFYTYNFYAFENKLYGSIIVPIYLTCLIMNIVLTTTVFVHIDHDDGEDDKDGIKHPLRYFPVYLIALCSQVIVELHCSTFFITRKINVQVLHGLVGFVLIFISVFITAIIKNVYEIENEMPRRLCNSFITFIFLILYTLSCWNLWTYDKNCIYLF